MRDIVGAALRRLRVAQGLKQRELGALAGLPQVTISAIERGFRMPKIDTMLRITNALGLSPIEIYREAGLLEESDEERVLGLRELRGLMTRMAPDDRAEVLNYAFYRERGARQRDQEE